MFYAYPDLKNRGEWILKEFPLFPAEKTPPFVSRFKNKGIDSEIISTNKMIFPDLVVIRKQKYSSNTKIKKLVPKPQYTLKNILTQVEKFPERVNIELSSNKQLSAPVVSLLSLLPVESLQGKVRPYSWVVILLLQQNGEGFPHDLC